MMIPFFSRPTTGFLAGLLGCAAAFGGGAAQAQTPVNFASSTGNSSTQTAAYGITPSVGAQQFLLTTINPAGSLPTEGSLGTAPANSNVTALNSYFGLPAGTLAGLGAQDGSGFLSQTLTLTAGAVVRFDFIFLTNEDNTLPVNPPPAEYHNDLAFFTVNGVMNRTIYSASMLSAAQLDAGSNSPNFNFQSLGTAGNGYTTVSYSVPNAGNYTFGLGVVDVATNTVSSGLLIDNFVVNAVPEPTTNILLALGTGGLWVAWQGRQRRRADL